MVFASEVLIRLMETPRTAENVPKELMNPREALVFPVPQELSLLLKEPANVKPAP